MKNFHGVFAGNVPECLLKSSIGKARVVDSLKFEQDFVPMKKGGF
jgi:hypothetical protein